MELQSCAAPLCCMAANGYFRLSSDVTLVDSVEMRGLGSITQVAAFESYSFHHSRHTSDLYALPVSDLWCPLQVKGYTPGQMSISYWGNMMVQHGGSKKKDLLLMQI
ncbi:unnamed protein product [Pleuronectes platessa]|uniref:Uncharacterized protein n=1 Tax=Pleuronectes platessa TaxID=8262 RepID=A0A9N7V135_PLEPL|nr:unnamed protein product [Pleuronectes platessa]